MTEFYLRYVPHERVEAYAALGWIDASGAKRLGLHGHWSLLMKWPHAGEPIEPDHLIADNEMMPSVASGRLNAERKTDG